MLENLFLLLFTFRIVKQFVILDKDKMRKKEKSSFMEGKKLFKPAWPYI